MIQGIKEYLKKHWMFVASLGLIAILDATGNCPICNFYQSQGWLPTPDLVEARE